MGVPLRKERAVSSTNGLTVESLQGLAVKEDVRERLQACIEEAQQEQGQ